MHALPVVRVAALQHGVGALVQADGASLELVETVAGVGVELAAARAAQAAARVEDQLC